ncbi:MAG: ParB/RepB/Spo0J family partition protein [Ruminococcaceae bacterium]|nr:ParB/RepB/Spo0J family partition protein [Oscillospiraceae bacterium]
MAKRGLGQGLDGLFIDNMASEEQSAKNAKTTVRISLIEPKPGQPRKTFESEPLAQLADSIAAFGVLQPILLREIGGGRYQIVAGERRWRASKMAGLSEIPAIILDGSEAEAAQIALIENIQREDLNPLEEAMAYRSLAEEYDMTQEEISQKIGKSRSAIANALRLLDLPEEILALLASKDLSAGHARTLLGLRDKDDIILLGKKTVEYGLSVRALEEEVKRYLRKKKQAEEEPEEKAPYVVDYVNELEKRMQRHLGRRVKINVTKNKKTVTLFFEDNDDLDTLLRNICGNSFVENE